MGGGGGGGREREITNGQKQKVFIGFGLSHKTIQDNNINVCCCNGINLFVLNDHLQTRIKVINTYR